VPRNKLDSSPRQAVTVSSFPPSSWRKRGHAEAAYEQLRTGLERLPDEPALHYFSSYVLRYAGLLEAARENMERSRALDPLVVSRHGGAPTVYLYLGERERFVATLSGLASPLNLFYEGLAAFLDPARPSPRDSLRRAFEAAPNDHFGRLAAALLALDEGRRQDALTLLRQLDLQRRQLQAGDGEFTYKIAQLAAFAQDFDLAMRSLTRAVELGFFCPPAWWTLPSRRCTPAPSSAPFSSRRGPGKRPSQPASASPSPPPIATALPPRPAQLAARLRLASRRRAVTAPHPPRSLRRFPYPQFFHQDLIGNFSAAPANIVSLASRFPQALATERA